MKRIWKGLLSSLSRKDRWGVGEADIRRHPWLALHGPKRIPPYCFAQSMDSFQGFHFLILPFFLKHQSPTRNGSPLGTLTAIGLYWRWTHLVSKKGLKRTKNKRNQLCRAKHGKFPYPLQAHECFETAAQSKAVICDLGTVCLPEHGLSIAVIAFIVHDSKFNVQINTCVRKWTFECSNSSNTSVQNGDQRSATMRLLAAQDIQGPTAGKLIGISSCCHETHPQNRVVWAKQQNTIETIPKLLNRQDFKSPNFTKTSWFYKHTQQSVHFLNSISPNNSRLRKDQHHNNLNMTCVSKPSKFLSCGLYCCFSNALNVHTLFITFQRPDKLRENTSTAKPSASESLQSGRAHALSQGNSFFPNTDTPSPSLAVHGQWWQVWELQNQYNTAWGSGFWDIRFFYGHVSALIKTWWNHDFLGRENRRCLNLWVSESTSTTIVIIIIIIMMIITIIIIMIIIIIITIIAIIMITYNNIQ